MFHFTQPLLDEHWQVITKDKYFKCQIGPLLRRQIFLHGDNEQQGFQRSNDRKNTNHPVNERLKYSPRMSF